METKKIGEIVANNPNLFDFQDPKYGNTLLIFTVMNQQIRPFKILLANKANVNIHNTYDGTSALIEACSFNRYDNEFDKIIIQK